MQKMVKGVVGGLIGFMVGTALLAGTAGAHVLTVTNRGNGEAKHHWVGANPSNPAHGKGLVRACEAHRDRARSAAVIHTPWNPPENCTHGFQGDG